MSVYDDAGAQWNIDPVLLQAISQVESGGNPAATSPSGAQGNMQFMPPTARSVGVADPRVPAFAVPGTAKLLNQYLTGPASGNVETALRMYQGGPDQSKWGPQNAAYAAKVAAAYSALKQTAGAPPTAATNPATMSDSDLDKLLSGEGAKGSVPGAPATPQQPSISGMSDTDLDKMLSGQAAPATAAEQPSAPIIAPHPAPDGSGVTTNLSDPDYYALQAEVAKNRAAAPAPTVAPAPPSIAPIVSPTAAGSAAPAGVPLSTGGTLITPQEGQAINAGQNQAWNNIGLGLNRAASWVDQNVPFLARLDTATGLDPNAAVNSLTAKRDQFNQQYGNNGAAQLGLAIGQTGATLPIMMGGGALLSGAGRAIAGGGNALSPALGSALETTGNFLSGAGGAPSATSAGSVPVQIASQGVNGALQGAGAALINSGQSDEPIGRQMLQGAAMGGAMGAAVPAANGLVNTLSGATSPLPPAVANLAQMARDQYGIQLSAPQLGMSPTLRYANNALKMVPGSGVGADDAAVQGQFNRAVARTFGEDAEKITPDLLSSAQQRIGGVMNRVENSANVALDPQFLNDAAHIENNARVSLPDSEFGVVRRQLDNVMRNLQPGDTISGTTYGNLIHKGSPLDSALNSSDANIRNYAAQIKESLRDSLTRSLSPEDAAAYQQARTQYKNLKTVQPLTLRADATGGPMPSTGDISPQALRSAVNRSYGDNVAMAPSGSVPLNDLARIGQLMKPPPSSGTAERSSMLYAGAKLAELAGAAAAGSYAGLVPAAAGLGAGIAGGRLAGAYLRSPGLANRMIQSSLYPSVYGVNPLLQQTAPTLAAIAAQRANPLLPNPRP